MRQPAKYDFHHFKKFAYFTNSEQISLVYSMLKIRLTKSFIYTYVVFIYYKFMFTQNKSKYGTIKLVNR